MKFSDLKESSKEVCEMHGIVDYTIMDISLWHHLGFDGKHVDCIPEREEML